MLEAKDQSYIHSFRIGLRENQIVRLEVTDNTGEKLAVGISILPVGYPTEVTTSHNVSIVPSSEQGEVCTTVPRLRNFRPSVIHHHSLKTLHLDKSVILKHVRLEQP